MASIASMTINISLKKFMNIHPLNLFLFGIYRIKIGKKWGKFLIILANPINCKTWWI